MGASLNRSILHNWHLSHGAQMMAFGGWEMPLAYGSLAEEHLAVRQAAGIFDISHMGQMLVRGAQALPWLQWVTTNDAAALAPGRMQYSLLAAEDGGLVDDIVVGCLEEDSYLVVVNAANTAADLEHLYGEAERFEVQVEHQQGAAMFALQGPASQAILQKLTSQDLEALPYYHLTRALLAGASAVVSRTGYTGEDGFEIFLRPEDGLFLWEALLEQGTSQRLKPCGLGARNTLRLEMAYPLYGHEIDRHTNPEEAGLGWVVKFSKGKFLGSASIQAKRDQLSRRLCGFELADKGVARDGYEVFDPSGRPLGCVTSGAPSPSLGKSIGLAYLPLKLAKPGREITVDVRGRRLHAQVVATPFLASRVRRKQ